MKINQKILSIPPYVSTSWKNVVSLHLDGQILVIGLVNGSTIEIPGLERPILENVFAAHEKYLEMEAMGTLPQTGPSPSPIFPPGNSALMSFPLAMGPDGDIGQMLQHNSAASDSPDLPPEMLEKIGSMTKMMGIESPDQLPKPEPHCNCTHCQIMRAIRGSEENLVEEEEEEEVSDDDLRFKEWDIEQVENNLYLIANPLNKTEHYSVFLGNPVGCTCGRANCEHIKAVLNS